MQQVKFLYFSRKKYCKIYVRKGQVLKNDQDAILK